MADGSHVCNGQRSPGDTSLVALNADHLDFAFLSAARYFCASFTEGGSCAWVTAVLGSESFFPGRNSAEKMRRALAVVHEMRTSRKSVFRFSNPRCQCCSAIVTQDEKYLLQVVQNARKGRRSLIASSAMLVCEGNDASRLVAAANGFAAAISEIDPVCTQTV